MSTAPGARPARDLDVKHYRGGSEYSHPAMKGWSRYRALRYAHPMSFRLPALTLAFAAILALPAPPAHALDPDKPLTQFRLTQWGVDDGLNHGSVHLITEDQAGFLWIGTLVGLSRFDGVAFRPALPIGNERIDYFARSIAFGKDGTWAVMSEGGVARRIDQRWQLFSLKDVGFVRAISPRRAGGYWLGSERGLFIMTLVDGSPIATPAGFGPKGPIWHLLEDDDTTRPQDTRLWMSAESGVYLKEATGTVRHLDREFGLHPRTAWIVSRDRDGVHWLGGRNGLIRFDTRHGTGTHRRYGPEDGLALGTVRWIVEDAAGSLWIATPGGGVQRFRDGRFETFNTASGLASDSVMSLHLDRAGNLWIGMAGGGIARLSESPLSVLRKRDGLTGDWIWAVQQDARGDVWVGTNGNGVTVLRDDKPVRRIPGIDTVWALHVWDEGRAIVSTTAGVARIERDDRLTLLAKASENEPLPRVFLRRSDGRLLIGKGRRIMVVTESALVATDYPEIPANIGAMLERPDGTLVIGTRTGSIHEVRQGSTVRTLVEPLKVPIFSMKMDSKGRIWAAASGLLLIEGNRHVHITGRNGFPDRAANEIILTNDDKVWLGTNRGILHGSQEALLLCLDKPDCRPQVEIIDERDGLPTAETNGGAQPGGMLDRRGRIWLPGINGLLRFEPKAELRKIALPQIAIDGLRADRQLIETGKPVPALTRDLEIEYTLPELTLPKRIEFRYRLLPHSPEWIDAGTRRTAFFAGLAPGRYTFEVSATRQGNLWDAPATSLDFDVNAAWYQTWWARLMGGVILFSALLLTPWLRFRTLRTRKQLLEAEVAARTQDLARANSDLDRLARTDALTGIANRREFNQVLAEGCAGFAGTEDRGVLAVIIADIDYFKAYNDHHGHIEGDDCLANVAKAVDRVMQEKGGMACRYGGEEFAGMVILPGNPEAEALAAALVEAVAALRRPHRQSIAAPHVTLSVGLATTTTRHPGPADLLRSADAALYEAKRGGRNGWRSA